MTIFMTSLFIHAFSVIALIAGLSMYSCHIAIHKVYTRGSYRPDESQQALHQ